MKRRFINNVGKSISHGGVGLRISNDRENQKKKHNEESGVENVFEKMIGREKICSSRSLVETDEKENDGGSNNDCAGV